MSYKTFAPFAFPDRRSPLFVRSADGAWVGTAGTSTSICVFGIGGEDAENATDDDCANVVAIVVVLGVLTESGIGCCPNAKRAAPWNS